MPTTIQQVELRHLRYIVTVADDLHFGKAADRLRLATPSLSKQIKEFEVLLGYQLFERRTRQVVLTKPGVAFVAEAREALSHAALALTLSAMASSAESKTAQIGYSPWLDLSWILEARAQLDSEIGRGISLHSQSTVLQVDNVLSGRLNAGIVVLPVVATGLTGPGPPS